MEIKKVERYECPLCYKNFDTERMADYCLYDHIKERCINHDLQVGLDLQYINTRYSMYWDLADKQKSITKDSCFVVSYLQCCDYPAYQIIDIDFTGQIKVGGVGGYKSYYASIVGLHNLTDPKPKEELYIRKTIFA